MGSVGDYWKDAKKDRQRAKDRHSRLCWKCNTRVWDTDEKCRYCDTKNEGYRPRNSIEGRAG
ncbi:MAG: hypothetical protein IT509_08425 [Rhodocyclaceae bacterium]|nr:hypothetical protein [Rhodocyclaceae bacterium]